MKGKIRYGAMILSIMLIASGCLDFGSSPISPGSGSGGGSGGTTVSGMVILDIIKDYHELLDVGLMNVTMILNDKEIIKTDEEGKFTISGLKKGSHTLKIITPIGARERTNEIVWNLTIPTPNEDQEQKNILLRLPYQSEMNMNNIEYRNLLSEVLGLYTGTRRWENNATITVNVNELSSKQEERFKDVFDDWILDLKDEKVLLYSITTSSNADITVYKRDDLKVNGQEIMACAGNVVDNENDEPQCEFNIDNGVIENVHIILNTKYLNDDAAYYIGIGEALGLRRVTSRNTIMNQTIMDPDMRPYKWDYDLLNILYSLPHNTNLDAIAGAIDDEGN